MLRSRVAGWVLAMAVAALLSSCGAEKTAKEVAGNLRPIDPEPYRAEIQTLEAILFQKDPLGPGETEAIAAALNDLADKVGDRTTGSLHTIPVSEMKTLSREVLWRGETGNRGLIQRDWLRIRGDLFDDAVWFREKGGEPRPVAAKKSRTSGDGELAEYTRVLEKLEDFVEHGRREIRSMGELPRQAAADPGLYANQLGVWEETGSEWNDDLVIIEGELPGKPSRGGNTSLDLAHENLGRAIGELRRVRFTMADGKMPTIEEREKHLSAAEDYLRRARQTLEHTNG